MWKKFKVNCQNIKKVSNNATLIACPHSSHYDGYSFWFPNKLIRIDGWFYTLTICDDFEVKLTKMGGKNHKEILTKNISADELATMFGDYVSDSYLKVAEPEKLEVKVEVLDEFKNKKSN